MSVPAYRNSRSRVRRRRSHHALSETQSGTCSNCGKPVLPHHACQACGFYKGRTLEGFASKKDLEKIIDKAVTPKKEAVK